MAARGRGIMVSEAVAEPHRRSFMIDSPEFIVIDSSSEEDGDDGMTSTSPDNEVQESDSVGNINASRTVDTASLDHTVDQAEGGATENTDRVTDRTRIEHTAQYKRIGVRSNPASKDFSDTSQSWEPRSSKVPRLDGQNQTGSVKHKGAFMCQACQSKFDSHIDLKKHEVASARCKKILKETQEGLTCLQCGEVFANENVKFIHITTSPSCKDFLRKQFENGHFHEGTAFFHDCSLNPNMCCYCLVTQDDIFNHILCSTKCRKKFERAVRQYRVNTSTEVSNLPTSLVTRKQSVLKQFACELCNKSYHTKRSLKRHISRAHEQRNDEGTATQTGGHIRPCEHLFCFKCKRYLKSAKEVEEHPCEHTKLLSRCWREKAVWDNGAYECKHCQEKFFNTSTDLKYHMHKHDKGKSPLFKYISCGKRQTAATTASMATSENAQHVSSRPAFQCGRCNLEYYSGKDFKNHILHTKECLKFYQHPQDQCPVKNSGCFVCKRKS